MNDQGYGIAAPFEGTDRFEVIDQLGAGAMCVVYRARDRKHGDIVALKTLRHLDSNSIYRLKQEFRALSQFDHPNLVSFSELVHSEQGWFVTMELVEGMDYLTFVRGEEEGRHDSGSEGSTWTAAGAVIMDENDQADEIATDPPRGLPDLIRLRSTLRQLAEGVQTLHGAGRVHRDLKPSNVLVTTAGRVVVLDFGLVAEIDQDYTEGTLHQNIAGSAAYMSPEQSVGRPLGEASDWYAVGVMLYEALTGVWPYQGHLYQILTKKQEEDPTPPKSLVAGVPDDLNDLAMALLDRDPEQRPSGAEIIQIFRSAKPDAIHQRVLQPRFRFRERQLEQLFHAFQTAKWGKATTVLVRGGPGLGKTKLIREFIKDIKRRDPVIVLKGQCFEWETVPYKALDGLMDNLSRVLRRLDHREVQQFTNSGLPYLAALFPVLNRVDVFGLTEPADLHGLDEGVLRQRGFEGLFQLLRELAQHIPLVIFLDDAQWGDELSAAVLGEILKYSRDIPILVLLAFRVDQRGPFIGRFLQPVQEAGVSLETLDLDALTFEQSALVASEMLDLPVGDERVRRIAVESGGVPQYVSELVGQLAFETGRESSSKAELNEITVSEISTLPDSAQRLLSLLAMCEQPLPDDVALVASGLSTDAFEAISTLRAHHLVNVQGVQGQDTLRISSEAVRDYVIDLVPEDWRVSFHGRLASAMEQDGSYPPESVVNHFAGAQDYKKAGLVAWLAASHMVKKGRHQEAVWLLQKASEYGEWTGREHQRILTHLGDALASVGSGKKAAEIFLEAAKGAAVPRARELHHRAAAELIGSGHVAEGREILDQLLKEMGVATSSGRGWFAGGLNRMRRMRLRWRGLDFSAEADQKHSDEDLFKVDLAWTHAMGRGLVHAGEGLVAQTTHLELALELSEPERALRALSAEVRFQGERNNPEWRERFEHVMAQARTRKSRSAMSRATAAAAAAALTDGAWVEAAELAESGEQLLAHNRVGTAWERFQCRTVSALAHLHRGDFRAAADRALPLARELEAAENHLFQTILHAAVISRLRMAEGDPDAGLAQLARTPRELVSQASIPFFHLLITWTELELYKQRPKAAWDYLQERWKAAEAGLDAAPSALAAGVWLIRARASIAMAATGAEPVAHLKVARAALSQASKLDLGWMVPWIQLAELGCARVEGPIEVPPSLGGHFQQTDQSMGGAVALAFTDERESAITWMADQGVRDPADWIAAIAPGLST